MSSVDAGIWHVIVSIEGKEPTKWWVLCTTAERAMGGVRGAAPKEVDVNDIEFLLVEKITLGGTIIIDPDILEQGGYVLRDEDEEDPFS